MALPGRILVEVEWLGPEFGSQIQRLKQGVYKQHARVMTSVQCKLSGLENVTARTCN